MKFRMKSTKLSLSPMRSSCCLVVLLLIVVNQTGANVHNEENRIRVTRQASGSRVISDRQPMEVSMSAAAIAKVSSSSSSSSNVGSASKPARPMMSTPNSVGASTAGDRDEAEELRPNRWRNRIKSTKRPNDDDYRRGRYEDEDCDDEDADNDQAGYGNMFDSMASNPMQHFRRMMNSVLDRMPNNFGFYPGDNADEDYYGSRRSGDSVASSAAAAYNSGNGGYSKLSSSVTSNGRTRGIISETRNGRTKTRRIGDDTDDADE